MANQGCRVCGGPLFRGQCPNRELHVCRVCGGELQGNACLWPLFHEDYELPSAVQTSAVERSINQEA